MELPLFLRDYGNRMYRTNVYFLSKTFAEVSQSQESDVCYHGDSLSESFSTDLSMLCPLAWCQDKS